MCVLGNRFATRVGGRAAAGAPSTRRATRTLSERTFPPRDVLLSNAYYYIIFSTITIPITAARYLIGMRRASIFALIDTEHSSLQILRIRAQNDGFRPTPIPLSEWRHERREGRTAGTLHETFRTAAPLSVAAVPAHYWEDALRHSVYLTLVRDKIDQLIAKGEVVSPDGKPSYDSKEIDDHDLWDKIKTAPFDRIQQEEPGAFGDVTIVAKGRLLEDKGGFRFAEDERSKEKCSDEDCMRDVKAFWSVKRVRQRDMETSPGKYHYELTFSVISQTPKKHRKPYENPIRTFTVKESSPSGVLDRPQEYRHFGPPQTQRPERSIWFHKNIAPAKQTGRKYYYGLDRIFSSFFSDDDEEDERAFDSPPPKYKQGPYAAPPPLAYSKIGHTGVSAEQHQQVAYPYRPHPLKHIRPPLQAPPVHPVNHQYNLDMGIITASNSNPYAPYPHDHSAAYPHDHRVEPSQAVKTTRPAVLPTPLPHKAQSSEVTNVMSADSTENSSFAPDTTMMHKTYTYNKYRTTPAKVNHFPDHVRPPIYNAPPGVFVTMDKKPFKPMPPLKLMHSTRPHRPNRPIDFRPSPQITDIQSTDGFDDTAFRPITLNFGDNSAPGNFEIIETTKKGEQNKTRKPTGKKPTKKHEKPHRTSTTTATPDIITAQPTSEEESETMDWANILGAFTKTTPMLSQTEKIHISEATTPMSTSTTVATARPKSSTTTEAQQESTSSTTVKPKRTRPPPKYAKQDKIKKHKRLSTTTTTTTTTTETPSTTIKKYTRPSSDLTPQASTSTVPKPTKPRELQNKTQTTTTTSTSTTTTTTTPKPTTSRTTTITTQSPITTKSTVSTTQSRSKSRFRQSALIFRGTSIKHDRWNGVQYNQTTTPSSVSHNRRKGSNFHGYVASTATRRNTEDRERNHEDRKPVSESISERTTSQTNYDETIEHYETNSVIPLEHTVKASDEDNEDSRDHSEFIFQTTTLSSTEEAHTPASNKTKCKKKKTNISTTEEPNDSNAETFGTTPKPYTVTTSTEAPTTGDIFEEFLNFNFNEEDDKDPGTSNSRADLQKQESSNQESYLKIDDFEEFLDMHLSEKKKLPEEDLYGNDDDDEDEEDSENDEDDEEYESKLPSIGDDTEFPSEEDEKPESVRTSNGSSTKRPYTLLELMAMA